MKSNISCGRSRFCERDRRPRTGFSLEHSVEQLEPRQYLATVSSVYRIDAQGVTATPPVTVAWSTNPFEQFNPPAGTDPYHHFSDGDSTTATIGGLDDFHDGLALNIELGVQNVPAGQNTHFEWTVTCGGNSQIISDNGIYWFPQVGGGANVTITQDGGLTGDEYWIINSAEFDTQTEQIGIWTGQTFTATEADNPPDAGWALTRDYQDAVLPELTINLADNNQLLPDPLYGQSGIDYEPLPTSVTFPAGASSVRIPLTPIHNGKPDWTRAVGLQVLGGEGYTVDPSTSVFLDHIVDNADPIAISPLPDVMITDGSVASKQNLYPVDLTFPEEQKTGTSIVLTNVNGRADVYDASGDLLMGPGQSQMTWTNPADVPSTIYVEALGQASTGNPIVLSLDAYDSGPSPTVFAEQQTSSQEIYAPTTTTLALTSGNPADPSDSLTFTATVSAESGSPPDGEAVTLEDTSDGNATIATGALSGGSATMNVPAGDLAGGDHSLIAVYAGDGIYLPSQSAPLTISVVGPPALVGAPVINGDDPSGLYSASGQSTLGTQRSMVEDVVYTFSEPVLISDANSAFTVAVAGPAGGSVPGTLYAAAVAGSNNTRWTVSLTGQPVGTFGSIANGEYSITINPLYVTAVSDGAQLTGGRTDAFYRLYGDVFGTESVTGADYNLFKKSIDTYNPMFDYFGTGQTSSTADYNVFKKDMNISYYGDGFVTTI